MVTSFTAYSRYIADWVAPNGRRSCPDAKEDAEAKLCYKISVELDRSIPFANASIVEFGSKKSLKSVSKSGPNTLLSLDTHSEADTESPPRSRKLRVMFGI